MCYLVTPLACRTEHSSCVHKLLIKSCARNTIEILTLKNGNFKSQKLKFHSLIAFWQNSKRVIQRNARDNFRNDLEIWQENDKRLKKEKKIFTWHFKRLLSCHGKRWRALNLVSFFASVIKCASEGNADLYDTFCIASYFSWSVSVLFLNCNHDFLHQTVQNYAETGLGTTSVHVNFYAKLYALIFHRSHN